MPARLDDEANIVRRAAAGVGVWLVEELVALRALAAYFGTRLQVFWCVAMVMPSKLTEVSDSRSVGAR